MSRFSLAILAPRSGALMLALVAPTLSWSAPAASATTTGGDAQRPAVGRDVTTEVLGLVLGSLGGAEELRERLPADLGALGADAVPVVLKLLDRRAFDARRSNGDVARLEIDAEHAEALVEGLRRMDIDALRAGLRASVTPASSVGVRAAALRALGQVAPSDGLDDLLGVLHVDGRFDPHLRAALEESTAELVRRHPAVAAELAGRYESLDDHVRPVVSRALGLAGGLDAVRALARLVGREPGLDPLVLTELGRAAEPLPRPVDAEAAGAVASALGSFDPHTLLAAVHAAGRIGDTSNVRLLVDLLDGDERGLALAAQRALRAITGRPSPASAASWTDWLDAEERWWDSRGERCLAQLDSSDAGEIAAAINELAPHALFAERSVARIADLLRHAEPDIVRMACAGLGRLRSSSAGPQLLNTLRHPDRAVQQAAAVALSRIYRRELPADFDAWRVVVE